MHSPLGTSGEEVQPIDHSLALFGRTAVRSLGGGRNRFWGEGVTGHPEGCAKLLTLIERSAEKPLVFLANSTIER